MTRWRTWAALGLFFAIPLAIVVLAGGKAVGPEPIRSGRDTCDRCHMLIAGSGFAGERRGKDGVLHKYDDVGCLLLALFAAHEETTQAWVEDHAGSGFVPLMEATLVRGDQPTPMGYGIVAFRDRAQAIRFASENAAQVTPLADLLRAAPQLSRFAAHSHPEEDRR